MSNAWKSVDRGQSEAAALEGLKKFRCDGQTGPWIGENDRSNPRGWIAREDFAEQSFVGDNLLEMLGNIERQHHQ